MMDNGEEIAIVLLFIGDLYVKMSATVPGSFVIQKLEHVFVLRAVVLSALLVADAAAEVFAITRLVSACVKQNIMAPIARENTPVLARELLPLRPLLKTLELDKYYVWSTRFL